ncbi:DUF6141 family protein [Halomicrococcus sp. NG-SE-24]|uniref:DUF6141 family protein n=1 Tax=Halomicrococcus sp. NG-SE-24 TaxID=3436928 RepID=UPI003D96D1CC
MLMLVFGAVSWVHLEIIGAVAAFLTSLRLETEVRADGISLQMWPIHRSFGRISWAEIGQYGSRTYRPLREFGGWGIRWAREKVAYTVGGNQGVWIQQANEHSIFVGSQRVEEFVTAIDEATSAEWAGEELRPALVH